MTSTFTRALGLWLLLSVACVGCVSPQGSGELDEDQVAVAHDQLALAALMIRDRYFERAGAVLAQIDSQTLAASRPEGSNPGAIDLGRYYTLRGLVGLAAGKNESARDDLLAAFEAGQTEPVVWLYLAQARYALGEHAEAVVALDAAQASGRSPEAWRMRINSHWRLKERGAAFAALQGAEEQYPKNPDFPKQRTLFLLELGLTLEAARAGQRYLEVAGETWQAHLTLGEALRRARQPEAAVRVLEAGRLRYPERTELEVALAHAHLDAQRPRAAAGFLESAARQEPRYLAEAAELYRRSGDLRRALYLNAQLPDAKAKTRQRLGLLLEEGALVRACALEPRLSRLELLKDEDTRYALAYAHFRAGNPDAAIAHLRGITRSDLFEAATDLRKAIEAQREGASHK